MTRCGAWSSSRTRCRSDQSIMRPTLLGSLLDAARTTLARDGPDLALFESGTVFRAARRTRARLPTSTTGSACCWRRARAADLARGEPPRGRLLRRQGRCSRPCSTRSRALARRGRRSGRSCIPGARRASVRRRRGEPLRLGFSASCTRSSRRAGISTRGGVRASTSARSPRRAAGDAAYATFGAFPPLREDLAVVVPDEVAARRGARRACATPAARARGGRALRRLPGEQVGEGRRSLALHLEFRAPDRTLTDEEVAPRARADRARSRELGGELRG